MISFFLAITLAWDPSLTPPPVNGYRLKYGTQPGIYTVVQDVGTAIQAEITGLAPGTYYFAAFAYNAAGESVASNEVQYVQASPSPTPTPSGATIAANINSVAPGGAVRAIVSNGPGNPTDWIVLAPVFSEVQSDPFNTWRYLHGKRVPPAVGITNATLTFAAPSVSGLYEFRLFEANSYNVLDSSEPIRVGTP